MNESMSPSRLLLALLAVLALATGATPAFAVAPGNSVLPAITTSEYRVGQVMKTTNGTWTPATGNTYQYSWLRCDLAGDNCATISAANGTAYQTTGADLGATIRYRVRGTNTDGSHTATSANTPEITAAQPPQNTVAPSITGAATEGTTLTGSDGTWTGPGTKTTTRKWQRCDAALVSCAYIGSATATTYKLIPADIGYAIRLEVTVTSSDGATTELSPATAPVAGVAPANTEAPTLSGETRDGQQLKIATNGKWTGTAPQTPSYRWERCAADGSGPCTTIAGATTTTYTLGTADIGTTVRGVVTMTNVTAATSASTATSAAIGPKQPPVVTTAPAITGTANDAQTLTATNGTWSGVGTPTYTRVWQRCDASGAACADTTVTATTLKLVSSDVGSTFRVRVTAKNVDGEGTETSAATAVVGPALPASTVAPVVSGAYKDGTVVSVTTGTWTGTPTITYAYQWQRCSPACADIAGETAATYRLTADDVTSTVRALVRATNAAGTASAPSNASATIAEGPPVNTDLPTITGAQARDGHTWTSTLGTWRGTLPQTYERHWMRCNASGSACVQISGAIDTEYKMAAADVGKTVRMEITALSSRGTTKALSEPSPVVVASRPEISGALTISGELRDGMTVTATSDWTGTPPIAYTYQWERCAVTCVDIAGATASSYKLVTADVDSKLKVRMGATNAGGGGAAESAQTATAVLPAPPVRTGDPTLSGTVRELATITASVGSFSGSEPLTRTYAWQRCSSAGDACAPIPGETNQTLVLREGWRGTTVRATVTATNPQGTASATSAASAVIALAPPVNTVLPAVSPNTGLVAGALLSTTNGGWTGSQTITYAYKWQRCSAAGAACADIPGETGPTYRAANADVSYTLRAVVIATNGADSTVKASLVTGLVGSNPPANDVLPALSIDGGGAARDGATLRVTDGEWSGVVPRTPSYSWERCDVDGENCSPIDGATASTYKLTPAEVGLTVRGRVTMTSSGGQTGVLTAPTAVVVASPPANVARPVITGANAVGKTLTASPGVWSGTPELVFTYQWQRCALGDPSDCTPIAGANASTYHVVQDDDGRSLKVDVTATNGVGTDGASSLTTAEIQDDPPLMVTEPTITVTGLTAVGSKLTGAPGTWTGAQPIDFKYQWRRCDSALNGCVDIAGATGLEYVLTKDDLGKRLLFIVTAENVVDVGSSQSLPTGTVLPEPPSNAVLPSIGATGGVRDAAKLTANQGGWKGATPMTYDFEWLRCSAAGDACAPIMDAIGTTYTLTSDDVGSRIRLRVTAKNTAAEVIAESPATAVVGAAIPASDARPTVIPLDGKPAVGGRLRGAMGTWKGTNPMTLGLQWQRCLGSTTAACESVPGATGPDYVLTTADVGMRMRILVTATNAAGVATADSALAEAVPAIAPASVDVPTVVGGPIQEGGVLGSTPGTWSGTQPITLAYQWERCKEAGAASCAKINGATSPTYALTSADVGGYVRLSVTAVNAGGKVTKSSVPTAAVAGLKATNTVAPVATLKGTVKVGTLVSVTNGTWVGTEKIKYEYRWQSCTAKGTACVDLDGGNKQTYKLTANDIKGEVLAKPLRAIVVATNVAGISDAASNLLTTSNDPSSGSATAAVVVKKVTAKKGAQIPAKLKNVKSLAQLKKLSFSKKGDQLQLKLICPKKAKTVCGITGRISMKGFNVDVMAGPIKKGKSRTLKVKLTDAQKLVFKGKARVNLRVRIAPPGTPNLAKLMKKKVSVPKALSGKVKSTAKKKSSKKKSSAKKSKSSKKKTSSKKKSASAKK